MAKLYVALIDDGRDDTLHIYSCDTTSDPTTEGNWSSEDTYVFDGPIKSVWMFQQSSDLHISVAGINERDDFGWVKYVKFDPGTTEFVQLDATNKVTFLFFMKRTPPLHITAVESLDHGQGALW
ncbi:MAG: hypothetical protein ACXAEN_26785 [Candidatus Thorarchaeota archaeon]|jgi:hypothetical protein